MHNNEEKKPLVTIGIPTYNRPKGFRRVLKNAIMQTYNNLEILISDNGSVCADDIQQSVSMFKHDSRIKYFRHEQNMGGIFNFEFLLSHSNGKYFIFFADDDIYDDIRMIEMMVSAIESSPTASAVMGSVEYIDGAGEVFIIDNPPYKLDRGLWSRLWNYLTTDITDNLIFGLFRADLVRNYRFERHVITPEKFLILYLLSKGPIVDVQGTGYKNIYSFKTEKEIKELFTEGFSRNHHIVWIKKAFSYLSITQAVVFSFLYCLIKLPIISWPFRKLLKLPKKSYGRKICKKEPYKVKFSNE